MNTTPLVIGVAGGSGSGKTTLARNLNLAIPNSVILSHDFYYKDNRDIPFEERLKMNYDHPNAFDTERMVEDLKKLKAHRAIDRPEYSFITYTRVDETVRIEPSPVIIVEGLLIFDSHELMDLMDIKIFVESDDDIRFIRRLTRDVQQRGRTLESVVEQYLTTVKPMFDRFIEPTKRHADIIVPRGGKNEVALSMILARIRTVLAEHN
ncbi:MAG: uridine kinase [Peptostreptococcaceae bacterium]|nr:uridine kinase [Peptostreptococcaceae bacterium]